MNPYIIHPYTHLKFIYPHHINSQITNCLYFKD